MGFVVSAIYTLIIYPLKLIIEVIFMVFEAVFDDAGIAVIAVSVGVSVLCLPLYIVAEKWQETERKKAASMAAGVSRIKKAFRGDEGYMVLSTFYRQNNYSPIMALRSSFGLLIQIPFFIAAYSFLSHCQMLQSERFLFIRDMGSPDALFSIGGFALNILPIAMTAINIAAGAIYSHGHALREKVQIYAMALVFLVVLYQSPAGLVLYWTMNNLFSLVKNIFYRVKRPLLVLYIITVVAVLLLDGYLLFVSVGAIQKRAILAAVASLLLFAPVVLYFAKWALGGALLPLVKSNGKRLGLFALSSLFLFVLMGVAVPSLTIASSVEEFFNIDGVGSALHFVGVAALQAAGAFIVWAFAIYFLFGKRVQALLSALMLFLALVALVNTFAFTGDYATLSRVLTFAAPVTFGKAPFVALNIAAILALVVLVVAFHRYGTPLMIMALLALSAASAFNIAKIAQAEKALAQKSDTLAFAKNASGESGASNISDANGANSANSASQASSKSDIGDISGANITSQTSSESSLIANNNATSNNADSNNANTNTANNNPSNNGASLSNTNTNIAATPLANKKSVPASPQKALYTLSTTQKNIVFIMLDRAESAYFLPIFDEYADVQRAFSGFTFFPNTVSFNQGTLLATPALFGGWAYTPLEMNKRKTVPLVKKHNEALLCVPRLLTEEAGFRAIMSDSPWANYSWTPDMSITDEYPLITGFNTQGAFTSRYLRDNPGSVKVGATKALIERNLLWFSLFRVSPVVLRAALYHDGDWWSSDSDTSDTMEALDYYSSLVYLPDATAFDAPTPMFLSITNDTTHSGADLHNTTLPQRNISTNVAALRAIAKWLECLKAHGAYDNTRFVITADHGMGSDDAAHLFQGNPPRDYNGDHNVPLLLYKDFGDNGALSINNDFMTSADTGELLLKGVIDEPKNPFTGENFFRDKSKEKVAHGVVLTHNWSPAANRPNEFKIPEEDLFDIKADVHKYDNWKPTVKEAK